MGSALSKAPKGIKPNSQPKWAGARYDPAAANQRPSIEDATKFDSNAVQHLDNLKKLGEVPVLHAFAVSRSTSSISPYAQQHPPSQNEDLQPHVSASTLTELLEEVKTFKRPPEGPTLDELARKYGIFRDSLPSILAYVNSPTRGELVVRRNVTEEGEELTMVKAAWTGPFALRPYQ